MTKADIDDIIRAICPNDEDFEKPCISPAYLKKELEALALEQKPVANSEWISIKHGQPTTIDNVLLTESVYIGNNDARDTILAWYDGEDWFEYSEDARKIENPVAWLPIPKPYRGD